MKFQTAFAMAHGSTLYLLDEVTAGMDPVFRMDFFKILHEIIESEQASVVMTSHIETEINQKITKVNIITTVISATNTHTYTHNPNSVLTRP